MSGTPTRAPGVVALTFDAEHPSRPGRRPGTEEAILDALAEHGVRATFFLQGRWATANPEVARRIAGDGHLVGNHSHHHAPLTALTVAGMRDDVRHAQERIRAVTGVDPRPWFRCPFGEGGEDPRVLAVLDALGYVHVGWNVAPRDFDQTRSAGEVASAVLEGVARSDGPAVVLLHAWPGATADMLPGALERLRGRGCTFATVSELGPPLLPAG
jgi:peptidoglycan/xylan/chitin deacetylase (PgdA/CDA1 family)